LGERDRFTEVGLGQFALSSLEPQFAARSERPRPVCEFIGIRLKRLFDRFKRFDDGAFTFLRLRQEFRNTTYAFSRPHLEQVSFAPAN
jgi:hypothetical protein